MTGGEGIPRRQATGDGLGIPEFRNFRREETMERILIVCQHNSARSQMAEAYLKQEGGDRFEVESAGFEPTAINPLVVQVMKEEGIDLAGKTTQSVFDLFKAGKIFAYVITVCAPDQEDLCPIFPGIVTRLHISFPDPAKLEGTTEEKLAQLREIRDNIKKSMKAFVDWTRKEGPDVPGPDWTKSKPGR